MSTTAITKTTIRESRPQEVMRSRAPWGWWTLYTVTIAIVAVLVVEGYSYYSTPYRERPRHEDYRVLRPAGERGLLYGAVGTVMMLVMHVYSLRKRWRHAHWLGGMRAWLNMHIFFGIMGPVFIVLHTSFKVQGLVAVSFWSMIGVALSGFVGRYLYQQIPRSIRGDELTAADVQQQFQNIRGRLAQEQRLSPGATARLTEFAEPARSANIGGMRSLVTLLSADLMRPLVSRTIRDELATAPDISANEKRDLTELILRSARLRRRVAVLEKVQRLFHHWHVIHKPFAVVMYVIMAVHITVAIWTGYGWIF